MRAAQILGLTEQWPANEKWEFDKLVKEYGSHKFKVTKSEALRPPAFGPCPACRRLRFAYRYECCVSIRMLRINMRFAW